MGVMAAAMIRRIFTRVALVLLLGWTVSAEAANLQFMPGDTAIGPATGTQTAPAIAEGNGTFLAVWQDLPTSPFVGQPFRSEGRGFDIYEQRLDTNGVPIDPEPFLIAQRFGDETGPQVAWDGANWLVAWGGHNSTLFNHRIVAVRIAPDGTILDDPAIMIHNSSDKSNFVLTPNGIEWLVTAHGVHSGENDFRGTRISGAGVVLNPGGTHLQAASSSFYNFDVVSAAGEYLFVWGNSSTTPRGQRYAADLTPIDLPFPVSSLNIASNGVGYFVSWLDQDASFDSVALGQQISLTGVPGPVVTLAGADGGLALFNAASMDAGWDGTDWWASWLEITRRRLLARHHRQRGAGFRRIAGRSHSTEPARRGIRHRRVARRRRAIRLERQPCGGRRQPGYLQRRCRPQRSSRTERADLDRGPDAVLSRLCRRR
jgi:hypothetical protein